MAAINPYLTFNGNTEEVFNFYKSVFGGEFAMVMRAGDTPMASDFAENERNKIMHMALPIGKNNVLMGSDAFDSMCAGVAFVAGNNFSVSVSADSKEEADKLYKGLSAGGKADMPMDNAFWGSYFGMLTDKFGIQWMVSYDANFQNN